MTASCGEYPVLVTTLSINKLDAISSSRLSEINILNFYKVSLPYIQAGLEKFEFSSSAPLLARQK